MTRLPTQKQKKPTALDYMQRYYNNIIAWAMHHRKKVLIGGGSQLCRRDRDSVSCSPAVLPAGGTRPVRHGRLAARGHAHRSHGRGGAAH